MLSVNNRDQKALADAVTVWLSAPDAQGRLGAMARRFGIMYIIWNTKMWRAYDPGARLAAYADQLPTPTTSTSPSGWDGPYGRTSVVEGHRAHHYRHGIPPRPNDHCAAADRCAADPVCGLLHPNAGSDRTRRGAGPEGHRDYGGRGVRTEDGRAPACVATDRRHHCDRRPRPRHLGHDGAARGTITTNRMHARAWTDNGRVAGDSGGACIARPTARVRLTGRRPYPRDGRTLCEAYGHEAPQKRRLTKIGAEFIASIPRKTDFGYQPNG
jgi:hypothetical protein